MISRIFSAVSPVSLVMVLLFAGCAVLEEDSKTGVSVVPAPRSIETGEGQFHLTPDTRIGVPRGNREVAAIGDFLAAKLNQATGFNVQTVPLLRGPGAIGLILEKGAAPLGPEGYELVIEPDAVILRAEEPAGLFWGVQTIRQLLPPEIESPKTVKGVAWTLPCVRIEDQPRFPWRGMLLDCGRHFMTKEYVKRTIDLLAYHKMNTLHWHLTEDQGWRIEIRKYPKLTEVGAWRTQEDGTIYGGFYTRKDIREVAAYAKSRYVTLIPEIEMPGHSRAALAAYPELSCTGGPFEVATRWGVHKDVYCAGKEKTFAFLEDVLVEVMGLFPAPYIHIGGDECPKDRWKECPDCQARIREEGLKDEHELQSYFIRRIEKFLQAKGRRIIGWDEILEGGLAPGATVQSWRGMEGAVEAATSGHDAIVSPTSHAYFDYDIATTDLRKVYTFEPIPPGLSEEEHRHILGGECNMWTEWAPQETVDGKVFPRLLAMTEVLWSGKDQRDYDDFLRRVRRHYERLDLLGVTYGPESRPLTILPKLLEDGSGFEVVLESGDRDSEIRYTLDGTVPGPDAPRYEKPWVSCGSAQIVAQAFRDGKPLGEPTTRSLYLHGAVGKPITLKNAFSPKYTGQGAGALADGLTGSLNFHDKFWQGFEGVDLEAVIDLGASQKIRMISASFLQNSGSWIFLPTRVTFSVSENGVDFTPIATFTHDVSKKHSGALTRQFGQSFFDVRARYVRVIAQSVGRCPDWHPGAGKKAWIFADEIMVNP